MSPDQDKEVYSTPMPIEEPNVFTLTLRTDVLNAKMDKIISSLSRIEDMLYEHTHLRKKSNYSSFNEAGHVSGGG